MISPRARRRSEDQSPSSGQTGGGLLAAPHDPRAEQALLGAVFLADSVLLNHLTVEVGLTGEDFYADRNRLVFEAMSVLYAAGQPVDELTVIDQLQRLGTLKQAGGEDAVRLLCASVPDVANAQRYARIVKDQATTRRVFDTAHALQALVAERRHDGGELIEAAESMVFALRPREHTGKVSLEEAVGEELARQREAMDGNLPLGVSTGLEGLDELCGGLHKSTLVIVAARPSMGKSAFVQHIAQHVAIGERKRVVVASPEMSRSELAQRYLAQRGRVDLDLLHRGLVRSREDWERLHAASAATSGVPLDILDSSALSVSEIRANARQIAIRHGDIALVVVDYLQLLRAESTRNNSNRTEDVSEMSRALKVLSRELDCTVIALSQLNRRCEERGDKRPMLSDLRDSGSIEQDADDVWMLYRDEYYNPASEDAGLIEVNRQKARQGPLGQIKLRWEGRYVLPGELEAA
jgi:replicative DNA helicase